MRRTLLLLLVLAGTPAAVRAQFFGFGDPISDADMLYTAGEPRMALDRLLEVLETDSLDYDALWRASRAAVVIGIDQLDHRDQNAWLDPAILWAYRAVEVRPDGIDGLYWRGVSSGRRALNAGPGYAIELAETAYVDAHAILAQDSLHAGAHNMLGKIAYEVMSLSRVKRFIARTFLDHSSLDDSSWEQAEYHLAKAAEVEPSFILFHFDLAQLHRKRGRREHAVEHYRRAASLDTVHPTDRKLQEQAVAQLAEWGVSLGSAEAASAPEADSARVGVEGGRH